MKILVVGGNGFVGSHLCSALRAGGDTIVCADRKAPPAHQLRPLSGTGNVFIDVSNFASVAECLGAVGPDVVINLASCAGTHFDELAPVIVQGPVNLIAAIARAKLRASVLTFGSAAEYGNLPDDAMPLDEEARGTPSGPYGIAKLISTVVAGNLAHDLGVKLWVVRPFNIVGAGCPETLFVGAIIARVLAALETTGVPEIVVGRMDTYRDFVSIADVIKSVRAIVHGDIGAGVYNVCSGQPTRLDSVVDSLRQISGIHFRWQVDSSLVRPTDPVMSFGSNAKLAQATGFRPQESVSEALRDAWNFALVNKRLRQT